MREITDEKSLQQEQSSWALVARFTDIYFDFSEIYP